MKSLEKNRLIIETILGAQSVSIIPSKLGGTDVYCAGAGLFHILKKNEKTVSFIYPGRIPENCEDVLSKEDIITDVKRKDLLVAINYQGMEVDKIQYSTEDGVFYLRFGPVARDFNVENVKAEVHGHKSDVYLIIGAQLPQDLGQTYSELEREFVTGKIINMDVTERNTRYGHYNIIDPLKDSMSLLALHSALEWDMVVTAEAAKAFLCGITNKGKNTL